MRGEERAIRRSNPPLAMVENPPMQRFAGMTVSVAYEHEDDGELYEHTFTDADNVEIFALRDGSLLIRHRQGKTLWEDFPV